MHDHTDQGHDGSLAHRFTYHPPTPEQPEVYQLVRDTGHLLALLIDTATHPSREQSLAVTKIEEAVMWANAAIARRGMRDAAYAGDTDLLRLVVTGLAETKPHSAVVDACMVRPDVDPDAAESFDPWPPDEHVTPTLEPLPAGHHTGILRSGLEVIAGRHTEALPINCSACTAQRILNGEPVEQVAEPQDREWAAVCPLCPAYITATGRGAQRDAQEWVLDHVKQEHRDAVLVKP